MNKSLKIPIVKPVIPNHADINENFKNILSSGMLTKGSRLREFEEAAADYLNVKHAIAVSSGTSGLMLAYQGLGLQGEAIVPSFTFMATVSALVWAGVKPVFVETDFKTRNIDPQSIEEKITPRTSAIIAVHNFGNPAPMNELQEIARRHGLKLIFDAAHAFGSKYQQIPIGSQGDAQIYSLSPTKLVIAGEGGIVATNNDDLAEQLRCGREYGNDGKYDSAFAGINGRMPEISAMLGTESLRFLPAAIANRNEYADFYRKALGNLRGIGFQTIGVGNHSTYKDFCITIDEKEFGLSRDQLAAALAAENIETRNYYDPPVHLQTAYRRFTVENLPVTEKLAQECLSLPMWSQMDIETLERVCAAIGETQQRCEQIRHHAGKNGSLQTSFDGYSKNDEHSVNHLLKTVAAEDLNSAVKSFSDDLIQDWEALRRIRHIQLKDLLPQPAVEIERENLRAFLKDKTVLVTGAGGSIGSELARQLAAYPLQKLLLLDRSEHGLFLI